MPHSSRRDFVKGALAASLTVELAGCQTTEAPPPAVQVAAPPPSEPRLDDFEDLAHYGRVDGERFPIPAVKLAGIGSAFLRKSVTYDTKEPPGTLVVDPRQHYLYLVQADGQALRYGVGVGREGFGWSGEAIIKSKQEWPDWYPPKEMLERQPELKRAMAELQSGLGMAGGAKNPLGARAMYLWQGNVDTLFRIHGTVEPWTIGKSVSSGCIRMINQDAIDLYGRTPLGTRVVVLGERSVG
jgi:lipoprotein-anchoring transpeptidase ErfK/SrfK